MDEQPNRKDNGALLIPGGLLLGLGIGLALKHPGAGVLIGLGAGFIAWAIIRMVKK